MTTPSSAQVENNLTETNKEQKKQTDKEKRLAHALRQNLLRRKVAGRNTAESDGQ